MELIAWAIYGLFLIGPYVALAIGFVIAVVLIARLATRVNRRVGQVTLALIFTATGLSAYKYLLEDPKRFNTACASGVGKKIFKYVKADSYAFSYTPNLGGGYLNNTDATFEQAIVNVASRRVRFVEIPDSAEETYKWGIPASLGQFRKSEGRSGYFRVFIAPRSSAQCRWLMPDDVKPLRYELYISYGLNHELNKQLAAKDDGKECIAVEYIASPTSQYLIEFVIDQKMNETLFKHEIRFVDRNSNNSLVGSVSAYEHKADGVYSSIAFWIGNGKNHPRCPLNLLEGNVVHDILLH